MVATFKTWTYSFLKGQENKILKLSEQFGFEITNYQ